MKAEAEEVVRVVGVFGDEFADVAEVTESDPTPSLHVISVRPTRREAAAITVVVYDERADVQVGVAGLWELGFDEVDRSMLHELLDATAAGRVEERRDLFGTNCKVWFADGSEHSSRKLGFHPGRRSILRFQPWRLPTTTG